MDERALEALQIRLNNSLCRRCYTEFVVPIRKTVRKVNLVYPLAPLASNLILLFDPNDEDEDEDGDED